MSIRKANSQKRSRRCLKCGKKMYTDRCHRLCPKCGHQNERLLEGRVATSQELRHFFRLVAGGGSLSHDNLAAAAAVGD